MPQHESLRTLIQTVFNALTPNSKFNASLLEIRPGASHEQLMDAVAALRHLSFTVKTDGDKFEYTVMNEAEKERMENIADVLQHMQNAEDAKTILKAYDVKTDENSGYAYLIERENTTPSEQVLAKKMLSYHFDMVSFDKDEEGHIKLPPYITGDQITTFFYANEKPIEAALEVLAKSLENKTIVHTKIEPQLMVDLNEEEQSETPVETPNPAIGPQTIIHTKIEPQLMVDLNEEEEVKTVRIASVENESVLETMVGTPQPQANDQTREKLAQLYAGYFEWFNNGGSIKTSDENERFNNTLKRDVLKALGYTQLDGISDIDQFIVHLSRSDKKAFDNALMEAKEKVLDLIPPQGLIDLYRALTPELSKPNSFEAQEELKERIRLISERMNDIINEYALTPTENTDDIVDMYDGINALLKERDPSALNVTRAKLKLQQEMEAYDEAHHLTELTPDDSHYLSERYYKAAKMLEFTAVPKYLDSIQFTNERGEPIVQATSASGILPNSEIAMISDVVKSTVLTETVTGLGSFSLDSIDERAKELYDLNTLALIGADLNRTGQNPQKAFDILDGLKKGEPYQMPAATVAGFMAAYVNHNAGIIKRTADKIGKDKHVIKKLHDAVKNIDTLAEKRFKNVYPKTSLAKTTLKRFGLGAFGGALAGGAGIAATAAALPTFPVIAGVVAGYTAIQMWRQRKNEVRAAKKQHRPIPSLGSFFKRNTVRALLTGASLSAIGMGIPALGLGIGATLSALSARGIYKRNRKEGFGVVSSALRTVPESTAALIGSLAAGGTLFSVSQDVDIASTYEQLLNTAAHTAENAQTYFTDLLNTNGLTNVPEAPVMPDAPQGSGDGTPAEGDVETIVLAHMKFQQSEQVATVDQDINSAEIATPMSEIRTNEMSADEPVPEAIAEQPAAETRAGTAQPAADTQAGAVTAEAVQPAADTQASAVTAEAVQAAADTQASAVAVEAVQPAADTQASAVTAEAVQADKAETSTSEMPVATQETAENPDELLVDKDFHTYDDDVHEMAEKRLVGKGVYSADGSHRVGMRGLDYTRAELNTALNQIRAVEQNHIGFSGIDMHSNAEILMYKLNQLTKLTAENTDINIDGQKIEVQEALGVKTENGYYSPHDLRHDLLAGKQVDPKITAQILNNVEQAIDQHGRFTYDIAGFSEQGKMSYAPDSDPGYREYYVDPDNPGGYLFPEDDFLAEILPDETPAVVPGVRNEGENDTVFVETHVADDESGTIVETRSNNDTTPADKEASVSVQPKDGNDNVTVETSADTAETGDTVTVAGEHEGSGTQADADKAPTVETRTDTVTPAAETPDNNTAPGTETADNNAAPVAETADKDITPTPETRTDTVTPAAETADNNTAPVAETADKDVTPTPETRTDTVTPAAETPDNNAAPVAETNADMGFVPTEGNPGTEQTPTEQPDVAQDTENTDTAAQAPVNGLEFSSSDGNPFENVTVSDEAQFVPFYPYMAPTPENMITVLRERMGAFKKAFEPENNETKKEPEPSKEPAEEKAEETATETNSVSDAVSQAPEPVVTSENETARETKEEPAETADQADNKSVVQETVNIHAQNPYVNMTFESNSGVHESTNGAFTFKADTADKPVSGTNEGTTVEGAVIPTETQTYNLDANRKTAYLTDEYGNKTSVRTLSPKKGKSLLKTLTSLFNPNKKQAEKPTYAAEKDSSFLMRQNQNEQAQYSDTQTFVLESTRKTAYQTDESGNKTNITTVSPKKGAKVLGALGALIKNAVTQENTQTTQADVTKDGVQASDEAKTLSPEEMRKQILSAKDGNNL